MDSAPKSRNTGTRFFPESLDQRLDRLSESFQRRSLAPRVGIDFSSNDYLGLSQDTALRKRILLRMQDVESGASGSRLLRGQIPLFNEVEENLARFSGGEAALLFPSGYQANLALLSGILSAEDWVFSDQLNHASLIDGMRLSRARRVVYRHRDVGALRRELQESSSHSGLKVIVTESLFGMDGDTAPLLALADLAGEFSALLVVDEAHATGLWGDGQRGGGLVQSLGLSSRVFATIHTGGKALGTGGAWVSGSAKLKDYLVNFSRPFIFSTAPLPALAVALDESVSYWKHVGPARAASLFKGADRLRESLSSFGLQSFEPGPIVPVLLGENQVALRVAEKLQEVGFDVRAIRPPTVPEGTARLRLCVHWDHSLEILLRLSERLQEFGRKN